MVKLVQFPTERLADLLLSAPIARDSPINVHKMHLMYYLDDKGQRVYTMAKTDPSGNPTISAHPARFSPDDRYSKQRVTLKRRFDLLPTQKEDAKY